MPDPVTHIVAYGAAAINSLKILELSAERDESNLFANIQKVQLANVDGAQGTAMTYEEVEDFKMGHLTFVAYISEVDEQSQMAIHKAQGETFLCKGKAYVASKVVQVLVFREKPTPLSM
jgi:hypothetical protein